MMVYIHVQYVCDCGSALKQENMLNPYREYIHVCNESLKHTYTHAHVPLRIT